MRTWLLTVSLLILALIRILAQDDSLAWLVTVQDQRTYDFAGTRFFELKRSGKETAVISIDEKSELARFLGRHNGDKVVLTLEVKER